MPIYEYDCLDCGSNFERIVSNKSKLLSCQTCGSKKVKKRYSSFSVGINTSSRNERDTGCLRCGAEQPGMCQQIDSLKD